MKQLLLATTALALCGQAVAADLRMPVKAAPVAAPPPAYSWTGCSIGGHIGMGSGRSHITDPNFILTSSPGEVLDIDLRHGMLGGVQAGCDYEFASHWVIGAAGDFSWANITALQANPDPFFGFKTISARTEWLASATIRTGYAFDHVLLYAKGGAAWTHERYGAQDLIGTGVPLGGCTPLGSPVFVSCNPSGSDTRTGWTAGLGFDWAFANNWTAGMEFDHYQFGNHTVTLTDPNVQAPGSPSAPFNIKERIEVFKMTLNYRFGWFGR
jgi:outer membrane immunogenic protein